MCWYQSYTQFIPIPMFCIACIYTSVFKSPHQIVNQLFHQGSVLSIPIWITFRSSKTEILPLVELSLNIKGANVYALIASSFLQLITLSIGIAGEYSYSWLGKPALNAWNRCDLTHCFQTAEPFGPNIDARMSYTLNNLCFKFHIDCWRPVAGIRQPFLIHSAIVTERNLIVSPSLSLCTFSRYSKLSQVPISLRLMLCCLIQDILDAVIFLSFFWSTS